MKTYYAAPPGPRVDLNRSNTSRWLANLVHSAKLGLDHSLLLPHQ